MFSPKTSSAKNCTWSPLGPLGSGAALAVAEAHSCGDPARFLIPYIGRLGLSSQKWLNMKNIFETTNQSSWMGICEIGSISNSINMYKYTGGSACQNYPEWPNSACFLNNNFEQRTTPHVRPANLTRHHTILRGSLDQWLVMMGQWLVDFSLDSFWLHDCSITVMWLKQCHKLTPPVLTMFF